MNRRINYGRNTPLTFRESLQFDRDCPYQLRCKDFVNDDIAPPHYAETMEIEVCCGITGEVVIENERIRVEGDTVVVVPPGRSMQSPSAAGRGRSMSCTSHLQICAPLWTWRRCWPGRGGP